MDAPGGAHGGRSGCPKWCSQVPRRVPRAIPTNAPLGALLGAPLGTPGDAHGCPSGCPERYPQMPLWVLQVMPTGAPVHGCRSGCPRAPLGAPCDARGQAGGGAGVGGNPTPGQRVAKGEKPPQKGAEAAAGRTAPLTQTKNPAAVPPRRRLPPPAFSGGPRSPRGAGGAPSPRSYILLVRRILAFALPQPIHTASAPGPRAGAGPPPLCPPRAPLSPTPIINGSSKFSNTVGVVST